MNDLPKTDSSLATVNDLSTTVPERLLTTVNERQFKRQEEEFRDYWWTPMERLRDGLATPA